jgi:hypothetical protein
MCAVDFDYELGGAADGATIYPSEEELHEYRKCTAGSDRDHQGVEVVTMSKEDFTELVKKAGIDPAIIRGSNISPAIWSKEKGLLKGTGN